MLDKLLVKYSSFPSAFACSLFYRLADDVHDYEDGHIDALLAMRPSLSMVQVILRR